jgi:GNAT superfamily N-acetyltransferase
MTETTEIRRAGPGDAEAIAALTDAAYEKWLPVLGRKPKPMTADYAVAVRHHVIDLLFLDRVLAALVEMIPGEDCVLVENLAVSPDFQGRGLGRQLMVHVEVVTLARGQRRVELYTNRLFAENIRFYQALGYRADREEPFRGGVITYMSKELSASA